MIPNIWQPSFYCMRRSWLTKTWVICVNQLVEAANLEIQRGAVRLGDVGGNRSPMRPLTFCCRFKRTNINADALDPRTQVDVICTTSIWLHHLLGTNIQYFVFIFWLGSKAMKVDFAVGQHAVTFVHRNATSGRTNRTLLYLLIAFLAIATDSTTNSLVPSPTYSYLTTSTRLARLPHTSGRRLSREFRKKK